MASNRFIELCSSETNLFNLITSFTICSLFEGSDITRSQTEIFLRVLLGLFDENLVVAEDLIVRTTVENDLFRVVDDQFRDLFSF